MCLYMGVLIIARIFASEIWEAYFGRAYLFFWEERGGIYNQNFTVFNDLTLPVFRAVFGQFQCLKFSQYYQKRFVF